ncbi:MAG TPA: Rne/Rng family ribonuclease [Gemmatimonadales bacterium]|nr:Rne/Rng family ribonuclease [Gemmatimonadales bacterium]
MKREILINGGPRETRVAILEDDRLVELMVDRPDRRRMVGDIYLGRVEAVLPGIQAAFVDIGLEKSAFLHASDLLEPEEDEEPGESEEGDEVFEEAGDAAAQGPGDTPAADAERRDRRDRRGRGGGGGGNGVPEPRQREVNTRRSLPNIGEILKKGQTLLVQVTKEPISSKGCRVTAQISLPGRFLVYMPYASRVGVSRKIESRELRQRLREMVTGLLPKEAGGVIVRTVAEGVTEEHFKREIESLLNLWRKINRKKTFVRAPALVQRETSLTRGIIRDLFSANVDALYVDSKELHHEIEQYLRQVDPDLMSRVHLYTDAVPLFDKYDIESEIRDLFKTRCDLPTGGYLIIQPTEALVSIDVNTGRYTGKKDPEKTILKTNLEAAREIARQLRLRDIGGIVVCDFIDMESRSNRDRVLQELRMYLGRDRARTKALAVSELGLVEMTRQRVRPSLWHSMTTECPACAGTGRVFTPEVVARRVERSLRRAGRERRERQIAIRLHPEVALYILEEEPKLIPTLGKLTGLDLEIRDDPMMRVDEFRLMSRPGGRDVTELYAVA